MIIRKNDRKHTEVEKARGGKGIVKFDHIVVDDSAPNNVKLFTEIILAPGDSVGEHAHEGECEIYFILSGECSVLDGGEYVKLYAGDVTKTDGTKPHAIVNDSKEDVKFLALLALD